MSNWSSSPSCQSVFGIATQLYFCNCLAVLLQSIWVIPFRIKRLICHTGLLSHRTFVTQDFCHIRLLSHKTFVTQEKEEDKFTFPGLKKSFTSHSSVILHQIDTSTLCSIMIIPIKVEAGEKFRDGRLIWWQSRHWSQLCGRH